MLRRRSDNKVAVSVLIPAFNEEKKIKLTIRTVFELKGISEVIVIDDGSKDKTYQKALETEAKVLQLSTNQGKGAALNLGLQEVQEDIILLLDADIGRSAKEADKLLAPVKERRADMTVAKFPELDKKSGFGLVKGLATWGLKGITGEIFLAPLSGQRVISKEIVNNINNFATGFGVEVALTIAVWKAGFSIEEIPVNMTHRFTGRDFKGFWHRGKQFKDILTVLASAYIRGVN